MIPPIHKWYPMVEAPVYPSKTDALERRAERLQEEELDKPCRNREKLFRRYFVIWFLRENRIPVTRIGKMIGKHHATVLHSLQQHELMM